MARARNLKPGFFKNEDLVELPFEYRLLFAGLWTLADREGRLEDRPKRIKMEIFPADNVDIEDGLRELARYGLVKRYESQSIKVVAIPKFLDHQHPHKNEVESVLPSEDASVSAQAPEQDVPRSVQAPEQDVPRSVQAPAKVRSARAESLLSESLLSESLLSESLLSESLLSDSLNPTGDTPVVPRAQAHATPSTDPPVDNFSEPQGLATAPDAEPEKTQGFAEQNQILPLAEPLPQVVQPAEPEKIPSDFGTCPDPEPDKPPAARRKKAPPGLSVAEVVAECAADPQHVQDWQIIRKVPVTPTSLGGIKREAGKAGISVAEAIRICAENGWRGFKASWLANQTARHGLALARASPYRDRVQAGHFRQNQAIEMAKKELFGEVLDARI